MADSTQPKPNEAILLCSICRGINGMHALHCPAGRVQTLKARQLHLICPKCHTSAVDVNAGHTLECRVCSARFSQLDPLDIFEPELTEMQDEDGGMIRVQVYREPGCGDFPNDIHLANAEREVRMALKKKRG